MPRIRVAFLGVLLLAQPSMLQAEPWKTVDPVETGWSAPEMKRIKAEVDGLGSTALMIAQDGKVIAAWGDVSRKVNVASVRKSLLGALYGLAIAEGRISLGMTLAELGIDDLPPRLTKAEKQATVRDLLMARSGVYHVAAHETGAMRRTRPKRGSHSPGSFWWYNNWDFNALGTIYRQETGQDIFQDFARRIAEPLGMEDFAKADGRYVNAPSSEHPAYLFRLSARDAARFGQLYLDNGRWNGTQIVPEDWIRQSFTPWSASDRGRMGYGFLWWTLNPAVFGRGAAMASGYGGQAIAVLPSKRLVIVQIVDPVDNANGVRTADFVKFMRQVMAAAPD